MAERHDQICDMKRQMLSIEEEVKRAHMKLQLKDKVIKELRRDLEQANAKVANANIFILTLQCMKNFYSGKWEQSPPPSTELLPIPDK